MTIVPPSTPVTPATLVRRAMPALVAVLIAAAVLGFLYGKDKGHEATIHHGRAVSAASVITLESDKLTIPTDVAWTDVEGAYHDHGRPECLPPVGVGDIDVTYASLSVQEPNGYELQDVVWVDCSHWNPSKDLTETQRRALASAS